ncbi:MAG: caspase family protein [Aureispira sp.]
MKKKNCYALFIGVDQYENAAVPDLSGCIQDAQRFLDYLIQHLNEDLYHLHARRLFTDTEHPPTRANIIASIQTHLGQAQQEDLILLFYAGHGSKEVAPPHFLEADGFLQTLVPSDARQPTTNGQRIRNILDKEIRFLLDELWQKTKAEIVFIQDSCHSTGATRQMEQLQSVLKDLKTVSILLEEEGKAEVSLPDPVARYVDPDAQERTAKQWDNLSLETLAEQYTAFAKAPEVLALLQTPTQTTAAVNHLLPLAPHIHLAACDKAEFAYEIPNKGGVFTTNLLEILEATQNRISYHDLYNRARLNIAGAYQQTPDLLVHHKAFEKRHQPFLGELLRHGRLPAQRDVDVFNGFYPVLPKGRSSWQIKAGEMELLAQIERPEDAVPIEVFLQEEQPIGQSNALITSVRSTFSKVEFQGISFDRRKHRNKLYAMIAPHFLRRWRVPTFVESTAEQGSLVELFENYGPRKQLKNFRHDGGPAIRPIANNQKPHFILQVEGHWLHLYDAQKTLLLKASAAQRQVDNQTEHIALWAEATGSTIYQNLPTNKKELSNPEEWSLSPYQKNALVAIFNRLAAQYQTNTQQSILVQLVEAQKEQHPFVEFQGQEAATLKYFEAFINWKTTAEAANFIVRTSPEGFSIHQQIEGQIENIPVCRQTTGIGKEQGFAVILALKHICKWQTVQKIYNKLQLALLGAHTLEVEATIYTDFKNAARGQRIATFQSLNDAHYQNKERGLSLPLHELTSSKMPLHFIQHPQYASTVVLPMSLVLHHLAGKKEVYISTLLLDSNFAILPLQTALGNNILPPKEAITDEKGSLHIPQLTISRPEQLGNFPQDLQKATFYIKILVAYERFDVSGLLQRGLAPAAPVFRRTQQEQGNTRAKVLRAPRKGEPGSWLSFTIPLIIEQPL